ncbi:MAG: metal ABC transporter substrate-binding protein [Paracoccus sp. (in: a-proteobacteria)]
MSRLLTALLVCLPLSAQADQIKVATSFTILADMARNVAGDLAEVQSITRPGAEIHDYQPTPRDVLGVQDADLILVNGMNLEGWIDPFLTRLGDVPVAVLTEGIAPIPIAGGGYDGQPNPHAWMSLDGAQIYVDNIATALASADPDNAQTYADNAARYLAELETAIAPLREAARALPEDRRYLVTSEGAFSYLARDFGLTEMYLWPINAEGEGTPQQVRRLIDLIGQTGAPVIFSESTVSDRPARSVAAETGADYGGVLYVDSLSDPDGPVPTYLDLLRVTADTIVTGLSAP